MSGINPTGKVLVLGSDFKNYRSCLTIIRSLGRKGLEVHVGRCLDDVAINSRYVFRTHDIPPYSAVDDSWKRELIHIIQREKFDLMVPVNEQASTPLETHRSDFEQFDSVYLLNKQAYDFAFDKFESNKLARSLDIKLPKETRVSEHPETVRATFNMIKKAIDSFVGK